MAAVASGGLVAVATWLLLAFLGPANNRALFVLGTCAGAAVAVRGAMRVAIAADDNEVVVSNVWRTHRVTWASIESITLTGVIWPSALALFFAFRPLQLRTRDGRRVIVQASVYDLIPVSDYLRDSSSLSSTVRWGFRFE